jgi:hypothetical protein
MLKVGNGFGVEVSCDDVGKDEGKIEYFIQALDTNGDLVGSSAKQAKPHVVPLVKKLQGRAPRFPDRPPPKRCSAGGAAPVLAPITLSEGDCPPGIAGCKSEEKAQACMVNDDCLGGQSCISGYCATPEGDAKVKPNIFSLSVQQDFLIIPGASHACNGGQHYSCFYRSNNQYFSDPAVPGAYDTVSAGMALATERIMAGYDRAFGSNMTLGARVGFAVNEGPQRPGATQSLPVHLEARAAYWAGRNALARKGFRFFLNAAAGIAEVDANFPVDARDATTGLGNPLVHLNAWTKTGQGFGALGLGGMWAFATNHGVTLEGKAMGLFPTAGAAFGLQLGYLYGL